MTLYELARDERANSEERRRAAEALTRAGLLRRERRGPSPIFLWGSALVLSVLAVGAASSLGPIALVPLVGGVIILAFSWASARKKSARAGVYVGPDGRAIHLPPAAES